MSNYTLYGTDFSLYTGKARAYLKYKKIPFEEVISTAKVYKDIIIPKTGVKFIPVVKTPEQDYLQETSYIIDTLELKFPERSVFPSTSKQRLVSLLLELYGDEWLLLPAMHYRWNHKNTPFIFQEFGKIVNPRLPALIRGPLGKKIAGRFKDMVPYLGVTEKTIPALEAWYEKSFLIDLDKHFSIYPFLLGDKPCVGDFGFYGPLFAHLYRDPYPGKLMKEIAPNVAKWVERMSDASLVNGEFLANDEVPETLFPIIRDCFDTQWPILEDTANQLTDWYARETNDIHIASEVEIPRRLGTRQFSIGGVEEQRVILPYTQWMMQRPLDYFQSLGSKERRELEPFLKDVNGLYAMRFNLETRVTRKDNRFVILE